jgi:twitching motility protein PilI
MANRQALRDLQTRLAERLQVARTEGVGASWLGVEIARSKYLFPLSHAGEIFSWTTMHSVPYTQSWFLGVANLRGGLFGIVDFASYLSGEMPAVRSEMSKSESRFVAINSALEVNCALLVDKLAGLRNAQSFVSMEDTRADGPVFFGRSFTDASGAAWQEINLQALTQQVQFLTIRA